MAIFWAFVCLFFSAANDFLFKCFARKPRSHGYFAAIIGVAWLATGLCFVRNWDVEWHATVFWGIVSGLCSISGNLLMLDAMRTLDGGVCSTIYRMNLVPVALGAALLLGETLTFLQWCGIAAACGAVILFLPANAALRRKEALPLTMMLAASLIRAGMGLSYRYGFLHGADRDLVVVIDSLFWIVGGVLYAQLRERRVLRAIPASERMSARKLWGYGVLSGALVAVIVLTMAASLALAEGKASVVLSIEQMSFLLTGVMGVVFLKEEVSWKRTAALLCGVAAILCLSIAPKSAEDADDAGAPAGTVATETAAGE